jgi:hypothetical protein
MVLNEVTSWFLPQKEKQDKILDTVEIDGLSNSSYCDENKLDL